MFKNNLINNIYKNACKLVVIQTMVIDIFILILFFFVLFQARRKKYYSTIDG